MEDEEKDLESRTSCVDCPFLLERHPFVQLMKDYDTGERTADWALFRRRCLCTLLAPPCRSPFNRGPSDRAVNTVKVEGITCRVVPSWLVR